MLWICINYCTAHLRRANVWTAPSTYNSGNVCWTCYAQELGTIINNAVSLDNCASLLSLFVCKINPGRSLRMCHEWHAAWSGCKAPFALTMHFKVWLGLGDTCLMCSYGELHNARCTFSRPTECAENEGPNFNRWKTEDHVTVTVLLMRMLLSSKATTTETTTKVRRNSFIGRTG